MDKDLNCYEQECEIENNYEVIITDLSKNIDVDCLIKTLSLAKSRFKNPKSKFMEIRVGYEWVASLVVYESNEPVTTQTIKADSKKIKADLKNIINKDFESLKQLSIDTLKKIENNSKPSGILSPLGLKTSTT